MSAAANLPALINGVRRSLDEARTLDDVVQARDGAKALMRMAKGVKGARDAYNQCGEIVVYAMAREGEELEKREKAKGGGEPGVGRRGKNGVPRGDSIVAEPMTLEELGISRKEASQAQRVASIPKAKLAAHLAEVKESGGEITTAGVLRLAAETKPKSPKTKAKTTPKKNGSAIGPIDLCTMEVRRIILATIDQLSGNEVAALLAELRDELEDIQSVAERRTAGGHHAARQSA